MLVQVRGVWMWKQELSIWMQERKDGIAKIVDELAWGRLTYIPRYGEAPSENAAGKHRVQSDCTPQASDFGADAEWWERWRKDGRKMSALKVAPPRKPEQSLQEFWIEQWEKESQ